VAGGAIDAGGAEHAIVWTIVPEPSAGVLLGVGIVFLYLRRSTLKGNSSNKITGANAGGPCRLRIRESWAARRHRSPSRWPQLRLVWGVSKI